MVIEEVQAGRRTPGVGPLFGLTCSSGPAIRPAHRLCRLRSVHFKRAQLKRAEKKHGEPFPSRAGAALKTGGR